VLLHVHLSPTPLLRSDSGILTGPTSSIQRIRKATTRAPAKLPYVAVAVSSPMVPFEISDLRERRDGATSATGPGISGPVSANRMQLCARACVFHGNGGSARGDAACVELRYIQRRSSPRFASSLRLLRAFELRLTLQLLPLLRTTKEEPRGVGLSHSLAAFPFIPLLARPLIRI
jgi:hypothetical protein